MKAAVDLRIVDLNLPARQLSTSIRVSEGGKETRGRKGGRGSRRRDKERPGVETGELGCRETEVEPSPRAMKGAGDGDGLRHG